MIDPEASVNPVNPVSVPVAAIFPLFWIVNLVQPLAEAVNKSPTPLLLVTREAKLVCPETEATALVPEVPLMSRVFVLRNVALNPNSVEDGWQADLDDAAIQHRHEDSQGGVGEDDPFVSEASF